MCYYFIDLLLDMSKVEGIPACRFL